LFISSRRTLRRNKYSKQRSYDEDNTFFNLQSNCKFKNAPRASKGFASCGYSTKSSRVEGSRAPPSATHRALTRSFLIERKWKNLGCEQSRRVQLRNHGGLLRLARGWWAAARGHLIFSKKMFYLTHTSSVLRTDFTTVFYSTSRTKLDPTYICFGDVLQQCQIAICYNINCTMLQT